MDKPELPTIGIYVPGYVYVIDYGDSKTFKIGMTTLDVQTRFKQIAKENVLLPMSLVMYGHVPNARQVENLLHLSNSNKHVRGEWFKLDIVDLIFIYQLLNNLGNVELYDHWFDIIDTTSLAQEPSLIAWASGLPPLTRADIVNDTVFIS